LKRSGVGAAIDELNDRPIPVNDHVDDLELPVGECCTPPLIIAGVTIGTHLKLAACHVLKPTVVGDHFCAALRVPQIPRFVECTHDSFRLSHSILLNLARFSVAT
jgi:hypothetical protein